MVIFDWDGTLCDSVEQIVRSVQGVARELGFPVPSEAAAANIIGLSLPRAMELHSPDESPQRYDALISAYATNNVASAEVPTLVPGALET